VARTPARPGLGASPAEPWPLWTLQCLGIDGLHLVFPPPHSAVANPFCKRQATQTFKPSPGNFPKTGDDTIAGGIFCISLSDLATYLARNPTPAVGNGASGGFQSEVGPYPAGSSTDPNLPKHTIFAPKTPPAGNLSMPFIAWGNGGCATDPSTYRQFLTYIASFGYVIAADGPGGSGSGQTLVQDMRASLDWATKGGAAKYGNVDLTRIATAGHSCGGLEAMSTAYHDERVKRIVMFNIAIFQDERRYLLKEINVPVAWFIGGKGDMGYAGVSFLPRRGIVGKEAGGRGD
jgi:hypothetical protein